jgi:Flagellar basal body-associated protein
LRAEVVECRGFGLLFWLLLVGPSPNNGFPVDPAFLRTRTLPAFYPKEFFNVSATPSAAAPVKVKSKKLIVIGAVLVLLVIVGAGAAWFLASRSQAAEDEEGAEPVRKEAVKVVPTFLPMENMVVNLADPGGDRFAQIGITLEVSDAKTAEQIKQYLPSIRSGILMLTSQRTSEELLQREGKEKLAADILREVSRPLGYSVSSAKPRREVQDDDSEEPAARRKVEKNPVQRVLFSSFIIQ